MPISYNKLFHMLIDRNMKKGELQSLADITAPIMSRLAKGETIRSDTIEKICQALDCQPGDIMEYIAPTIKPEVINQLYERYYETYGDLIEETEFEKIVKKCVKSYQNKTIVNQDKLTNLLKTEYTRKYEEQLKV